MTGNEWKEFVISTKRKYKKRFGRKIKTTEIKKIWDEYLDFTIERVLKGGEVIVDKYSRLEVVGTPIWNDKNFIERLKKGKALRNGYFVTANLNPKRRDVKYKIVYTNTYRDVYFKPHPNFSKQVHQTLCNTNNYFRICQSIN